MYYYSYENLRRITQTEEGKKVVQQAKALYDENFADEPVPALNYSYQKMFKINGNRNLHETLYFLRRKRLQILQILAIADDAYSEPLEEILAAICDEFTWVLPAHLDFDGKNENDYTMVDLFSSETGAYLAETAYIFGDKLSGDIRKRIRLSIQDKIIKNYESRTFWWETATTNWAAVCSCSVGLAYLYAFPERFDSVKGRLFKTFENYLNGVDEEGYCSEGEGYWWYGFGFFSIFFDVYTQLKEERPKILQSRKVENLAQYWQNARLDEHVSLPYADGGSSYSDPGRTIVIAIMNLFGDLVDFSLGQPKAAINSKPLGARFIYGIDKYPPQANKPIENKTVYYKNAQVFIHKNKNYAFTAKGGNNEEIHNHNDVGTFQIVKNDKCLICDLGAGEYTRQYFDPEERYSVFVCRSISHSVPIIGNDEQRFGQQYHGEVLEESDSLFKLELAKAYDGGVDSLIVTYEMQESGVRVRYEAKGLKEKITFRFVSFFEPVMKSDGKTVSIENLLQVVSAQGLAPEISAHDYKKHSGTTKVIKTEEGEKEIISYDATAYTIDYTMTGTDAEAEFYFNV